MSTILVVHGAWSAAWSWKKIRGRMRDRGHDLLTPTLTGLGERAHLAGPDVGLDLHIQDVLAVIENEDLHDIVLLCHSYGGMVATAVANRVPDRVAQLIYLDAFVPQNGQCVFDLLPVEVAGRMREQATSDGDGWRLAPNPLPPDTPEADREWILSHRIAQPILTHTQPILLDASVPPPPRTFIRCARTGPVDVFRPFAEQVRADPAWRYFEMDASHSPHITAPDALANLLGVIIASPTKRS